MRKLYFECEFCQKKAHDTFPKEWVHGKSLVIGFGIFSENRVRMFTADEQKKYLMQWDITFCSLECFFKWVSQKMGKDFKEADFFNPSSTVK